MKYFMMDPNKRELHINYNFFTDVILLAHCNNKISNLKLRLTNPVSSFGHLIELLFSSSHARRLQLLMVMWLRAEKLLFPELQK